MLSYDKDKLTKTMRDVENAGRALSAELSKLNTFYKDLMHNDAFSTAKNNNDKNVVSFIYQHEVFESACNEISRMIKEVMVVASDANDSLAHHFNQVEEQKIEVLLLDEYMDADGNEAHDGSIKKGDTIMNFYVVTSLDPTAQKFGEGLVVRIRIYDLSTKDILTYQKPGTLELSSKNDSLMEGFVKLLRMFD